MEMDEKFEEAYCCFSNAYTTMTEIGVKGYATDALAGQARCSLKLGYPDEAVTLADQVFDYIVKNDGVGLEFPILAYLSCGKVYAAQGEDTRTEKVIEAGNLKLKQLSDKINDPELRSSFLQNVPEHQEIQRRMEK